MKIWVKIILIIQDFKYFKNYNIESKIKIDIYKLYIISNNL